MLSNPVQLQPFCSRVVLVGDGYAEENLRPVCDHLYRIARLG